MFSNVLRDALQVYDFKVQQLAVHIRCGIHFTWVKLCFSHYW